MVLLYVLGLLLLASPLTSANPVVTWASYPVLPNDVVMLAGAGFTNSTKIQVTAVTTGQTHTVAAIQPQPGSLKFILPSSMPLDQYEVIIEDNGRNTTTQVNGVDVWWFQGDKGDYGSPGGWIRMFGRGLHLADDAARRRELVALRERRSELERALSEQKPEESSDLLESELLHITQALIQSLRSSSSTPVTRLRLTPSSGSSIDLVAEPQDLSTYQATFRLPSNISETKYTISVSNGAGRSTSSPTFTPVDVFESSTVPHLNSINIRQVNWPKKGRFDVTDYGPHGWPKIKADWAVQGALSAAAKAGGGTVYFPRGQYYLTQPIAVPANTVLRGEGTSLVSIFFEESQVYCTGPTSREKCSTNAPNVLIYLNVTHDKTGSWGLSNLTFYVTAFHQQFLLATNTTNGFYLRGVRTRVNAWFAGNDIFLNTRGRWANFSMSGDFGPKPGPLLVIHARNWEITDCDLYGDSDIIQSYSWSFFPDDGMKHYQPPRHGASYGYIARNFIYNGQGSSHFMNQWMQVIFEHNDITGIALRAMGNSVGTAAGGVAHHIYHADNRIRFVWGNDREVVTFDDAGAAYYGPIHSISGTTLITEGDTKPTTTEWSGWFGGAIVILNGTGAGQYRRIVVPGIYTHPTPKNRTWIVDRPWDVLPGKDSWIEIEPYRGQTIFLRDYMADAGAFQFYGHALDNIVAELTVERITGFLAWGQWRAPHTNVLKGICCQGAQPNLRNQYIANEVLEGNKVTNYNSTLTYDTDYFGYTFVTIPSPDSGSPPEQQFIVWRRNVIKSNGGFWIASGTQNAIIDRPVIKHSDVYVRIDTKPDAAVYVRK